MKKHKNGLSMPKWLFWQQKQCVKLAPAFLELLVHIQFIFIFIIKVESNYN